jgi:ABC-type xylose transport system permease subunit
MSDLLPRALRTWIVMCGIWAAVSVLLAALLALAFWDSGTREELAHFAALVFLGTFFAGVPIAAVAAVVHALVRRVGIGDPARRF